MSKLDILDIAKRLGGTVKGKVMSLGCAHGRPPSSICPHCMGINDIRILLYPIDIEGNVLEGPPEYYHSAAPLWTVKAIKE